MAHIKNIPEQGKVRFEWVGSKKPNLQITQSYGLCMHKGKVCIIKDEGDWTLLGGTVEEGEDPKDTLIREIWEEANLKTNEAELLGYQIATHLDKPSPLFGNKHAQTRWLVHVTPKPLTKDPCTNTIWTRKFVELDELNNILQWGDVLDTIIQKTKQKLG